VAELKRLLAAGKLHNNPMCCKFLLALEKQKNGSRGRFLVGAPRGRSGPFFFASLAVVGT
jgi:hypothetical protein